MVTTRPLCTIYFDGQSVTLTESGTLDSQIILLQGKFPSKPDCNLIYDEGRRALDLCALVKDLGIGGIVHMNAGSNSEPSASSVVKRVQEISHAIVYAYLAYPFTISAGPLRSRNLLSRAVRPFIHQSWNNPNSQIPSCYYTIQSTLWSTGCALLNEISLSEGRSILYSYWVKAKALI
jgi:hypothetical protein